MYYKYIFSIYKFFNCAKIHYYFFINLNKVKTNFFKFFPSPSLFFFPKLFQVELLKNFDYLLAITVIFIISKSTTSQIYSGFFQNIKNS